MSTEAIVLISLFSTFFVIIIISICVYKISNFIIKKTTGSSVTSSEYLSLNPFKRVKDSKIMEFIPNFNRNSFLQERYLDYIKIKNALYDFNFTELKKLLTEELYTQVKEKLPSLVNKQKKYEVDNYTYYCSMITDIFEESNKLFVKIELIYELNYKSAENNSSGKDIDHIFLTFVCDKNLNNNSNWLLCKKESLV